MTMVACFDMGGGGSTRGEDGEASQGDPTRAPKGRKRQSDGAAGASVGPVRIESDDDGDRFGLGAPSVVRAGAPSPSDHPAGRSDAEIRELFARKSRRREQGIREVIEQAKARGSVVERFVAAIQYDSELAPKTTNRRQLLELGIDVPAGDGVPTDATEVSRTLWTIIYGLARLGIFLTGTDTYDDRALLEKLCTRVLVDEVSDIPPSGDLSEFIDLTPPPSEEQDPDGLVGPFEYEPHSDDDEFASTKPGPQERAKESCEPRPVAVERDRLLPRPDRR